MPPRSFTLAQEKVICQRYLSGESAPLLGKELSVCNVTILNILRRNGEKPRSNSDSHWKYKANETVFDTLTDESAYWIGFLMADGCVVKPEGGESSYILLGLQRGDVDHIRKFMQFLDANNPTIYNKNQAQIHITSTKLVNALVKYGVVPQKSLTAIPKGGILYNRHFWRGMIDGDGSLWIHKRGFPMISLAGSYGNIKGFRDFMKTIVPTFNGAMHKQGKIYILCASARMAMKLIKYLYQDCDRFLSLKRKYDKTRKIVKLCDKKYNLTPSKMSGNPKTYESNLAMVL